MLFTINNFLGTLAEAKKRLTFLETNEYVYSGSEMNKRVEAAKKRIRSKKITVSESEEDSILQVLDITKVIEKTYDSESDSSSSITLNTNTQMKDNSSSTSARKIAKENGKLYEIFNKFFYKCVG